LGSRGRAVRELQHLLRERGFDLGGVDGVFGARTRATVVNFQRSRNLPVTGIVDVATWQALGPIILANGFNYRWLKKYPEAISGYF
jgi:peptidoglycan hydrolase-like protein with peptidoglycan-binding domain